MKYNHALFLNPYIGNRLIGSMMLFPPTGLEYVATSAKGFASKITLIDLKYEEKLCDLDKLLDFVRNEIDIICVAIGWDYQLNEIFDLLNRMPENIPLVVGGYTATEKVDEIFNSCPKVDIVVRGEGEETIQEILKDMSLEKILGISYRVDGKIVHNGHRPLPDVDSISAPDRGLRRSEYRLKLNGRNITGVTFDSVLSARGCPQKCKFCTFSLNPLGQKRNYAARSVESVVKEIEAISANAIIFSDDNLFVDIKRAEKICDMLLERKIKKRFIAQARIDIARSPALLEKMVKVGFKALMIGIESPHDRILKQLNKGFYSNDIRKAFAILRKYPIYYHGYFIFGNIGETEEEMLYIGPFAREIGVDSISIQKLRIEKFSPLKELALNTPGYHVTERGELYSDTYSHAALKKIGKKIKASFYTPFKLLELLWKAFFTKRFFTFYEMALLILSAPILIKSIIVRKIQKNRLSRVK